MSAPSNESVRQVLPTNVRPSHYDLTVTPDLVNFTFAGEVVVTLTVKEATNTIKLNYKELEITSAVLHLNDGSTLEASEVELDKPEEIVTLHFATEVAPQEVRLAIKYTGILNDKMAGFYRSGYTNAEGETAYLATTQFEPADARRAFPCWDEPSLKATFDVTLRVPRDKTALGNMDVISTTDIEGTDLKAVKFATTPIMATYIVAFVTGDFDYIEGHGGDVRLRVYTQPGQSDQGKFALETGKSVLSFFTSYFDIPYPLPKLDMVAVPDFAAGAMENWGLVTYRSISLLYNEESTSAAMKQRIAYVVAHELAHQWFGNIVTMEWWTDLWLNEGFATWVGWRAVDHVFPEWKVWDQFISAFQKRALLLDGLKSSHSIQVEVKDVHKLDEIFDGISYAKGASGILMLATFLGEESFRAGLRSYLRKFMYSNAITNDLWAALKESSGIDVGSMMATWTKQMGYPVISAEESNGKIHVTQIRYLGTGKEVDEPTLWAVPLRILTPDNEPGKEILREREGTFDLPSGHEKWWKLNGSQAGFFRVQYPESLLPRLGKAIAAKEISVRDRCGVVNDAFALASAGYHSTTNALELLSYFKSEDDDTVWTDIVGNLSQLASVLYTEDQDTRDRLRAFRRELYAPVAAKLGFDVKPDDSHLTKMLRSVIIQAAGGADVPEVVAECRRRFDLYAAGDHSAVQPDLLGPVSSVALAFGDDAVFDNLLKIYDEAQGDDARVTVLTVIGSGGTEALVRRALELVFADRVRSQDVIHVLLSCTSNPVGRSVTWAFFQEHWNDYYDRFASGSFMMDKIVAYSCNKFVSEERAAEVEAFFAKLEGNVLERTISQCTETIRANAAWVDRDRDGIKAWLQANTQL